MLGFSIGAAAAFINNSKASPNLRKRTKQCKQQNADEIKILQQATTAKFGVETQERLFMNAP